MIEFLMKLIFLFYIEGEYKYGIICDCNNRNCLNSYYDFFDESDKIRYYITDEEQKIYDGNGREILDEEFKIWIE